MARRITQTLREHMEWIERMDRECPDAKVRMLRVNALELTDLVQLEAPGHPDDGLEIELVWTDFEAIVRRLSKDPMTLETKAP